MSRKKRAGEVVCTCGAYPFPHRQFGGSCVSDIASRTWDAHQCDTCRNCRLFEQDPVACAFLDGRESIHEAECLMEHVDFHEIRLYGVNKPASRG